MHRLIFLTVLALSTNAHGEEFLGIEKGSEEESQQEQPPVVAQKDETDADSSAQSSGRWSGSGGLWPGVNQFSAAISVAYHFNPYVAVDTQASYSQFKTTNVGGTMYGPEVDLVLRLTNPTILTPFGGAGIGYDRWARTHEGDLFDDGGSMTASAFAGLQISLTKHFGLQGMRKQKIYLADAPVSFDDRKTEEPQSRLSNTVGFFFAF